MSEDRNTALHDQTPFDELALENQLCFSLYAASKEIIKQYKPLLAPLNLTYTQYLVMLVLWEQGDVSVKELGSHLCLDSGTLTPVLKKIQEKQLLNRIRDPHDERSVVISLTPDGHALKQAAEAIPETLLSLFPLTAEEAATLQRLAVKLVQGSEAN